MRAAERYTSPSQLEAELRVVFRRFPVIAGRESELPEPGSFFTHDDAGVALLLTRDASGTVRAMLNVCSHRGTRLVAEDRGTAASFVCKYHGWTYGLEGRLARPGRVGLPPALEQFMDDRALTSLPCETRHGFVWVVPTPRASIDIAAALGPLDDVLRSLDAASLDVADRASEVRASSWKHVVETYLDAGARAFVLPSSFLVPDERDSGGALSHVAVYPRTVDESVVITTRLVPRSAGASRAGVAAAALAALPAPSADLFHAALDRAIAAHPRRLI